MDEVDNQEINHDVRFGLGDEIIESVTDVQKITNGNMGSSSSLSGSKGSLSSFKDGNSSNISQDGTSDDIQSDLEQISVCSQPTTSTPLRNDVNVNTRKGSVRFETSIESSQTSTSVDGINEEPSELILPEDVKVPIIGYEIMEERAKFTVFKIKVEKSDGDNWFVFRRYTDFIYLNEKLKKKFTGLRLALPPKRWFKDNFDRNFIDDRILGLQAFANNITTHKDICNSKPVREFFCFDEPPGPHDSLEESRALCDTLEETVYKLRRELSDKDRELELLTDELNLYKNQVEMLSKALRNANDSRRNPESPSSTTSLAECDILTCPEADQSQIQTNGIKMLENKEENLDKKHTPGMIPDKSLTEVSG